jgi:hypothetical protein
LHMRERLEQNRPINREFHRSDAPILLWRSQPLPDGSRGQTASEILPGRQTCRIGTAKRPDSLSHTSPDGVRKAA